ncbi:hypothetical protein [Sinorhizobium fredii]|uniref:hypothetical protein n=1 Tax=Rhizobium fredii TaxID=380 RepID=UPI0018E974EE|nr:hypothetical protein [Sinorhizobium fredii]
MAGSKEPAFLRQLSLDCFVWSSIIQIGRASFKEGVRRFLGGDIRRIASSTQEYADFVS